MGITRNQVGYFLGPILFIIMLLMPPPAGMELVAWRVAAVTVLMAIWWITEAIPIPATALLPIALFPLLNIMPSAKATAPYANHLIFLFMGGFFIAVTMEKWNLHRRVALNVINLVGMSPQRLILGFMLATALLSAWISNTATAMMMVPIGIAVISQITKVSPSDLSSGEGTKFSVAVALMLAIAWGASIGGIATIIGTPPNVVLVGQVKELYNVDITFLQWMLFGVPISLLLLFVAWLLLTKILFKFEDVDTKGVSKVIKEEIKQMGKPSKEEVLIILVGLFVVTLWITKGLFNNWIDTNFPQFKGVHDATIGIIGALLLFIIPSDFSKGEFLLDWKTAVKIPWNVVLLFGGGLALAGGFQSSGLTAYLASQLTALEGVPMLIFIFAVVALTVFLTEITSNTATATLLVPVMGASAIALSIHPFGPIVAACVSASCAFMLPVATPPNAVVFGSGCVNVPQMAKAGLLLNFAAIVVITLLASYFLPLVWGINLDETPAEFLQFIGTKS